MAVANELNGRVQRPTERLWRIYIQGVGLQTYFEGRHDGPLPEFLIIGPLFCRHEHWENLPFAVKAFIMQLSLRLYQWPDRIFQEVRIIQCADRDFTEIWVKLERGRIVTAELAEWFYEMVISLLGRPVHLPGE
jgi:hypothetical protein